MPRDPDNLTELPFSSFPSLCLCLKGFGLEGPSSSQLPLLTQHRRKLQPPVNQVLLGAASLEGQRKAAGKAGSKKGRGRQDTLC